MQRIKDLKVSEPLKVPSTYQVMMWLPAPFGFPLPSLGSGLGIQVSPLWIYLAPGTQKDPPFPGSNNPSITIKAGAQHRPQYIIALIVDTMRWRHLILRQGSFCIFGKREGPQRGPYILGPLGPQSRFVGTP